MQAHPYCSMVITFFRHYDPSVWLFDDMQGRLVIQNGKTLTQFAECHQSYPIYSPSLRVLG